MDISDKIKEKVSTKYHDKIDDFCSILDRNKEYKVISTKNKVRMELLLKEYNTNPNNNYITLITLCGSIVTSKIRVSGDFVAGLLRIDKQLVDGSFVEEFVIITYEVDDRLY